MKFLCLPGAYGSAKVSKLPPGDMIDRRKMHTDKILPWPQNFSVQLGPFAEHMEKRGLATFTYAQGEHEVDPPAGWEHYFGSRPLYRFLDASERDAFEALRRVRQLPRGLTPEATLRLFEDKTSSVTESFKKQFRTALDRIRQVIDEDPEIDAILGYSEGAMLAASILYEEHQNWVKDQVPRRLKASHGRGYRLMILLETVTNRGYPPVRNLLLGNTSLGHGTRR